MKGLKLGDAPLPTATGKGYAVILTRAAKFALGKGAPVFIAYRRNDAVRFRDELREHGVGPGKVVRVE